jgi:hypothetical protein
MITKCATLFLTGVFFAVALNAQVLPPLPAGPEHERKLATSPRLFVRGFQFEGNNAFSDAALAEVTGSYTNRELGIEDLELARRAVTLYYINHGFVNSGASRNRERSRFRNSNKKSPGSMKRSNGTPGRSSNTKPTLPNNSN